MSEQNYITVGSRLTMSGLNDRLTELESVVAKLAEDFYPKRSIAELVTPPTEPKTFASGGAVVGPSQATRIAELQHAVDTYKDLWINEVAKSDRLQDQIIEIRRIIGSDDDA